MRADILPQESYTYQLISTTNDLPLAEIVWA